MILGIDFGSTTTDVVLMNGKGVSKTMSWQSDKFDVNTLFIYFPIKELKQIKVTGYGSLKIQNKMFGIPVKKVDEIKAIGLGGTFVAKKKNELVVSIGSGTCMVSVNKKPVHIGGTSIGGGTLKGLSELLINTKNLKEIEELAKNGILENIDLTMKDIYPKGIGMLPPSATASHFGKLDNPTDSDKALALINMVAQSIATLAVFAAKAHKHRTIVLTGRVTGLKPVEKLIKKKITSLFKVPVIIPKYAEYATAIGAVLG